MPRTRKSTRRLPRRKRMGRGEPTHATGVKQRLAALPPYYFADYSYSIDLDDSEMEAVRTALSHYVAMCEREIAQGATVPFIAGRGIAKQLGRKLLKAIVQTQNAYGEVPKPRKR
jgi:hypothetical protein